jgi:hypothetical protein
MDSNEHVQCSVGLEATLKRDIHASVGIRTWLVQPIESQSITGWSSLELLLSRDFACAPWSLGVQLQTWRGVPSVARSVYVERNPHKTAYWTRYIEDKFYPYWVGCEFFMAVNTSDTSFRDMTPCNLVWHFRTFRWNFEHSLLTSCLLFWLLPEDGAINL